MAHLSSAEHKFIADGIAQDLRNDGRGREDFRPFVIQTGVIPQANGSARLQLGGTDVLASVKAELGSPQEGRPNQGRLEIAVECSPTAAPEYEGRGGDELASELARALERCFLGGGSGAGAAVDLSALSIVEGKTCWALFLDALLLGSDGNLLDAIGMAFKAALSDLRLPKVVLVPGEGPEEEGDFEVSDDLEESSRLDVSQVPVIVTLTKVGRHHIVDATAEEETQMSAAMSVAVSQNGHVNGVSKRGSAGLDSSVVIDMLSVAGRIGKQLHRKVDAEIALAMQRASQE